MKTNPSPLIKRLRMPLSAWALFLLAAMLFASCKETDNTDDEYADWENRNEQYFQNLYTSAQQRIAAGDTSWKIIKCYSLPDYNATFVPQATDNIVVHVVDSSKSTSGSPLYTDSVRVHYLGRLMPTTQHPQGYVFDKSYSGDFNPDTAIPSAFNVSAVVDGFATALQHMKVGDRWEVYMPWQLGYSSTGSGSIPGYSTLMFDMQLTGYYHAGYSEANKAKAGIWIDE